MSCIHIGDYMYDLARSGARVHPEDRAPLYPHLPPLKMLGRGHFYPQKSTIHSQSVSLGSMLRQTNEEIQRLVPVSPACVHEHYDSSEKHKFSGSHLHIAVSQTCRGAGHQAWHRNTLSLHRTPPSSAPNCTRVNTIKYIQ